MRLNGNGQSWPARPWLMAAVGAAAALAIYLLTDHVAPRYYPATLPPWRLSIASSVCVAAVCFMISAERLRLHWALGFSIGAGLVAGLIGWNTASYNHEPSIFEYPFWASILALTILTPLFQTVRDEEAFRLPYARLYHHVWVDAAIGLTSLLFTGLAFLTAWLIAGLFYIIGIEAVKDALSTDWIAWILAGFAFGGCAGRLRQAEPALLAVQRLMTLVLEALCPLFALAIGAFLLLIPLTGLDSLWNSGLSATSIMLLSAAGALLLVNAVIGDGTESRGQRGWLWHSAMLLAVSVLPLAALAALSLGLRVGQYGWTPERLWGAVAVATALLYGLVGCWAVVNCGRAFDERFRPLQSGLAIAIVGAALFLAAPILDFGAISAGSQLARLQSGSITPDEFDWTAMAFDFGPAGRKQLVKISEEGPALQRQLASQTLSSDNRYSVTDHVDELSRKARLDRHLRLASPDIVLDDKLRANIAAPDGCNNGPCALLRVDAQTLLLVYSGMGDRIESRLIDLATLTSDKGGATADAPDAGKIDLRRARIEIRPVRRKQLYVDGRAVGQPFE